jgi:hypothetical protein
MEGINVLVKRKCKSKLKIDIKDDLCNGCQNYEYKFLYFGGFVKSKDDVYIRKYH